MRDLIGTRIWGKLRRLRAALRGRLLGEGVAWLVVALVAAMFVTLALDWATRLERPLRMVVTGVALACVAWVAWREILRPMAVPMNAEALVLLVERRWGRLGDRLISALQFAAAGDLEAVGMSAAMVRRVADEANALAADLPFGRVVRGERMLRVLGIAGASAGLAVGFAFWQPDLVKLWYQRNVAFQEVAWPQDTYLRVLGADEEGGFRVLRGEDLAVEIVAEADSDVPDHVVIHARYPSVGMTEERIELSTAKPRHYVKVFKGVSEPLEFYVTGGDDRRDKKHPHAVRLIDPPGLKEIHFTIRYPAYMNRSPGQYDGASAVLPVPLASRVEVVARATKDLRSVRVLLNGKPVGQGSFKIESVGVSGRAGPRPRGFRGSFSVPLPAGLDQADRKKLLRTAQTLKFAMVDTGGYKNKRGGQFMVQIQPDQAPTLELRKRAVGTMITPIARIPLTISVRDDCGVGAVRVMAQTTSKTPKATTRPAAVTPVGGRTVTVEHELDLKDMGLKATETLRVRAEALDTLPAELGGPNVGRSASIDFRIVTPDELRAELIRRQKQIRLEFEGAITVQESSRAKVIAAAKILTAGKIIPQVRRLLSDSAAKLQISVAAETARTAEKLQAVLDEMSHNRIGQERDWHQLGAIISPILALPKPMRQIEALLSATDKITDVARLAEQAGRIADIQAGIRTQMEQILKGMIKFESRQELAGLLELLIREQRKLTDQVDKLHEKTIGEILKPK